jgi:hypothetical protein
VMDVRVDDRTIHPQIPSPRHLPLPYALTVMTLSSVRPDFVG